MKSRVASALILTSAVWMLTRWNQPATESPILLHAITYNVHLLPPFARAFAGERGDNDYRAQQIGIRVSHCDVVALCECFDAVSTDHLVAQARANANQHLQVVQSSRASPAHLLNGGLVLLTRHKIVAWHEQTYRHASRILTSGIRSDGYVAKGVIHARLNISSNGSRFLDVFVTHLDSRSKAARAEQFKELVDFVATHSKRNVPFVVLGDFNVAAPDTAAALDRETNGDTEYESVLNQFRGADRPVADSWTAAGRGDAATSNALSDAGERIDYIFVSAPANAGPSLIPVIARTLAMLDDHVPEGSLSDHKAVECLFDCRF